MPEIILCPKYDLPPRRDKTQDLAPYENVNERSHLAIKQRQEALSSALTGNNYSFSSSLDGCIQDLRSAYSERKNFTGEEESSSDSLFLRECVFLILWGLTDCTKLRTILHPTPGAEHAVLELSILLRSAAEYQAKNGKVSKNQSWIGEKDKILI
jgi:hypothetical protein